MDQSMAGKVCVVTGANSGLGKETALALAQKGAQVVMICRSREKAEAARAEIVAQSGNKKVDVLLADLSLQADVRKVAEAFLENYDRLDVLMNNAGLVIRKKTLTPEGFETQFATNHLAPFLLTNLLRDMLEKSAPSRVVTVASGAHWWGRINFENLNGERRYNGWLQYSNTKLANILFTRELARKLDAARVTANCLHPGGVNTAFATADTPALIRNLAGRFMLTPAQGAQTSIFLASSPEVEGITGKYFAKCREARSSGRAKDDVAARRLWEESAKMTGLAGV